MKEGFIIGNSIQDQLLYLVKVKGMTKAQAIEEMESILRVKLPDKILETLEV